MRVKAVAVALFCKNEGRGHRGGFVLQKTMSWHGVSKIRIKRSAQAASAVILECTPKVRQ